jgi:hypothetical protein
LRLDPLIGWDQIFVQSPMQAIQSVWDFFAEYLRR